MMAQSADICVVNHILTGKKIKSTVINLLLSSPFPDAEEQIIISLEMYWINTSYIKYFSVI